MSSRTINEQGAIDLVKAIVDRAVYDFMATTPGSSERIEIEHFFLSDYFATLTGGNGNAVLKKLNEKYDQKKKKARKGSKHDDQ